MASLVRHAFVVDLEVELTSEQLDALADSFSCEVRAVLNHADVYVDHRRSLCAEVQVSRVWAL